MKGEKKNCFSRLELKLIRKNRYFLPFNIGEKTAPEHKELCLLLNQEMCRLLSLTLGAFSKRAVAIFCC